MANANGNGSPKNVPTFKTDCKVRKDKDAENSPRQKVTLTFKKDCDEATWDGLAVAHLTVLAQNKVLRPILKDGGKLEKAYTFSASTLAARGGVLRMTREDAIEVVKADINQRLADGSLTKEQALEELSVLLGIKA
jgi:hypothetical protein